MFCRPQTPPERDPADRYADTRGEIVAGETSPTARALTAAMVGLWGARPPRPRPISTEGGRGRAEPATRLGDDIGSQAWRELQRVPEGGDWLDQMRRGFRPPDPGQTA